MLPFVRERLSFLRASLLHFVLDLPLIGRMLPHFDGAFPYIDGTFPFSDGTFPFSDGAFPFSVRGIALAALLLGMVRGHDCTLPPGHRTQKGSMVGSREPTVQLGAEQWKCFD